MAVNIEVRVDPERRRQAEEAVERARLILGGSVADIFAELGQSMVAAGAALSTVGEAAHQSIAEAARMELNRRLLAQWIDLGFLPSDTQVSARYDNLTRSTIIEWIDSETGLLTGRRIPDEARYRTPVVWSDDQFRVEHLGDPEEADSRARYLLLSCLSPAQRKEFKTKEAFTVVAKSGRRYRIERGLNYSIAALNNRGKVIGRLCAGPDENVPVYDSMLSQKLWLENDEEGFLRIANRDGFISGVEMQLTVEGTLFASAIGIDGDLTEVTFRYADVRRIR